MAVFRGSLSPDEKEIIEIYKHKMYPEQFVHTGFAAAAIIKEILAEKTAAEIKDIVQKNSLDSNVNREETSLRINSEALTQLEEYSMQANISKIAVFRACLFAMNKDMNAEEMSDEEMSDEDMCDEKINSRPKTLWGILEYWSKDSDYKNSKETGVLVPFIQPLLAFFAVSSERDRPLIRLSEDRQNYELDISKEGSPANYIPNILKARLASDIVKHKGRAEKIRIARLAERTALMRHLAELIYSPGNEYPTLDKYFIRYTGILAKGSLSIMVDVLENSNFLPEINQKIAAYNEKNSKRQLPLLTVEHINEYRQNLIEIRKKAALEDWYDVRDGKLIANPLFPGESYRKPLPTTEQEIEQYLINILTRVEARAFRLR